jgi:hypothetical protein
MHGTNTYTHTQQTKDEIHRRRSKERKNNHRTLYKKKMFCLIWKRMFNDNYTNRILNTQYLFYSKSNGLNKGIFIYVYIYIYFHTKELICTVRRSICIH